MRKALIVGIDYYNNNRVSNLNGCVNDAFEVEKALKRNTDGSLNFDVKCLTCADKFSAVSRKSLKDEIRELFKDDAELALLYFSGHGYVESVGGYLMTTDVEYGDDGLSMNDILYIANNSPAKNKVIILDCCYSGALGSTSSSSDRAILAEGVTILAASAKDQYAMECEGSSVFTSLLVDALSGSAANLVGDITLGSVYAHIDQALGSWEQRPIFKTNIKTFISLKKSQPPISLDKLKRIPELFKNSLSEFMLDPSFEPTSDSPVKANTEVFPVKANTEVFSVLQKLVRVNLVKPQGEEHMYHAAMNSKSCKLTELGRHYWNLVKKGRI